MATLFSRILHFDFSMNSVGFTPCALNGLPTGMQAQSQKSLILKQDKTNLLTTQAQPRTTITTAGVLSVAVVDRDGCHKWLGCILFGNNRGSHRFDLEYHLQAASKTLFAHTNILCDKAVSLVKRFQKTLTKLRFLLHVSLPETGRLRACRLNSIQLTFVNGTV